jgi:hypothetical protein
VAEDFAGWDDGKFGNSNNFFSAPHSYSAVNTAGCRKIPSFCCRVEMSGDDAVNSVHMAALSAKTRRMYQRSIGRLFAWLFEKHRDALEPEVLALATLEDADAEARLLQRDVIAALGPPLQFQHFPLSAQFTVAIFEEFLTGLRTKKGLVPDPSTLNTHRSGLTHLFSLFQHSVPADFAMSLKEYFKGAKRISAAKKSNGEGVVRQGKEPLSFSLYAFLCGELLKKNSTDAIFAHAFMTLSWNLMCRAGTFLIRWFCSLCLTRLFCFCVLTRVVVVVLLLLVRLQATRCQCALRTCTGRKMRCRCISDIKRTIRKENGRKTRGTSSPTRSILPFVLCSRSRSICYARDLKKSRTSSFPAESSMIAITRH